MSAIAFAPVAPSDRIAAMDVVRGFALLGILLMNIEGMVGPLNAAMTGLDPALQGADRMADALVCIFVQGKFYALFSLLFGMGFAVMMQRAEAAGRAFVGVYVRRTLMLFAFGLAHMLLVWSGDILTTYAVVAFLLLWWFRRTPLSQLPWWGVALCLVPALAITGFGLLGSLAQLEPTIAAEFNKAMAEEAAGMARSISAQRQAFGGNDYFAAVAQRFDDMLMMFGYMLLMGWQILGLFVLGTWFVRSGAIADPQAFPRMFTRMRWVALPLGLALMLWSFWLSPTNDSSRLDAVVGIAGALALIGSLLMSLGYLAWIVRGLQSPAWERGLALLAPAGRMALTNYLLQSVVMTLLFYGYGLGWFEQLPRAWQVPFVLAFFALQVVFSRWWLQRFRYGPLEWLWRAGTYLHWPALRPVSATAGT
ncbi:MAG TPA: DUF418 domain-containing protein [Lysobacter sp.]